MAISGVRNETEQGTATSDTRCDQAPQCFFGKKDHDLAFQYRPRLYYQITNEHVSFDHIAKAFWIGNDPKEKVGKDEKRVSQFLEYLARRKFSDEHAGIEKDYWNRKPMAGCALTRDGYVHSVMNITDPELVLTRTASTSFAVTFIGLSGRPIGTRRRRRILGMRRRCSTPFSHA